VGVALGHLQVSPAAEFLKHSQRRAGLGLPACSRVPHAVEGDLLQCGGFAFSPPHRGGELPDRCAAAVHEDLPVDLDFREPEGGRSDVAIRCRMVQTIASDGGARL
jgi:hypothetical protein